MANPNQQKIQQLILDIRSKPTDTAIKAQAAEFIKNAKIKAHQVCLEFYLTVIAAYGLAFMLTHDSTIALSEGKPTGNAYANFIADENLANADRLANLAYWLTRINPQVNLGEMAAFTTHAKALLLLLQEQLDENLSLVEDVLAQLMAQPECRASLNAAFDEASMKKLKNYKNAADIRNLLHHDDIKGDKTSPQTKAAIDAFISALTPASTLASQEPKSLTYLAQALATQTSGMLHIHTDALENLLAILDHAENPGWILDQLFQNYGTNLNCQTILLTHLFEQRAVPLALRPAENPPQSLNQLIFNSPTISQYIIDKISAVGGQWPNSPSLRDQLLISLHVPTFIAACKKPLARRLYGYHISQEFSPELLLRKVSQISEISLRVDLLNGIFERPSLKEKFTIVDLVNFELQVEELKKLNLSSYNDLRSNYVAARQHRLNQIAPDPFEQGLKLDTIEQSVKIKQEQVLQEAKKKEEEKLSALIYEVFALPLNDPDPYEEDASDDLIDDCSDEDQEPVDAPTATTSNDLYRGTPENGRRRPLFFINSPSFLKMTRELHEKLNTTPASPSTTFFFGSKHNHKLSTQSSAIFTSLKVLLDQYNAIYGAHNPSNRAEMACLPLLRDLKTYLEQLRSALAGKMFEVLEARTPVAPISRRVVPISPPGSDDDESSATNSPSSPLSMPSRQLARNTPTSDMPTPELLKCVAFNIKNCRQPGSKDFPGFISMEELHDCDPSKIRAAFDALETTWKQTSIQLLTITRIQKHVLDFTKALGVMKPCIDDFCFTLEKPKGISTLNTPPLRTLFQ